jgi:2-polyprenyl-6-methoxyphenol hydroxylase-like FAD-dependent oxidoreductase
MASLRVLVSGGGIAGATLAYWLSAGGHHVTIVERAGQPSSSGSPVDVRGEAAVIAHSMGIWPRLAAASTGVERLVFVDADGAHVAVIRTRRTKSPDDEVEVARAELAGALLGAVGGSAEVRTGDAVVSIHRDGLTAVDVRFASGREDSFDIVVGADGVHSGIRKLAFGPEEQFSRPMGLFIGTVLTDTLATNPDEVLMFNQPGTALALHPAGGHPGAAFIFRSDLPYDHRDPGRAGHLIEDAYREGGWITGQALQAWRAAGDVYFDRVTRLAVPEWASGRIVLVGDAASCVSLFGEGSSNAILGAKTLADAINATPRDPAAAFEAYQRAHQKVTRRAGAGAPLIARLLVPKTRRGIALRNSGLRAFGQHP